MKRLGFIVLALVAAAYLFGCGKKEATLEESQVPMSMDALNALNSDTKAMMETNKAEGAKAGEAAKVPGVEQVAPTAGVAVTADKLAPLPPQGPYKPSGKEIQTALKKAGFYTGKVDGKIGPKTKKAIEDFQTAKGLKVDGKIGTKTWAALSTYLNSAPTAQ